MISGIGARLEMALGVILSAWGLISGDPMTVAIGFPFFLDAASNLRFERVERQLADLGAQHTVAR